MSDQYIPGEGCACGAWNESECGCGVEWTPTRQRELEAEVAEQARLLGMSSEREAALRAKIERLQAQLHIAMWIIEKQEQREQQVMSNTQDLNQHNVARTEQNQ